MSTYAHIVGGVVAEMIAPPAPIATCYSPEFVAALIDVTSVSPAPQPGWTYEGTHFAAPVVPAPTPEQLAAQAYAAFISGGLTVTSDATPALSGVYAIDDGSQSDIGIEAQFITTFAEFTTGATTNLPWPMPNGSIVIFPTPAAFLSFAKVAGQKVAAAKFALATRAAMPAATATIP